MRDGTLHDWHFRVDRALRTLLARLDDPPALEELAAGMASSPFHFHRMFRTLTGETVGHCIRRLRLEHAGSLLRETGMDITAIALEAGFTSGENLARAFRRTWGMAPSRARRLEAFAWKLHSPAGIHYSPDLAGAERWHFRLHPRGETNMEVKIVSLPAWRLAALEHVGDYWELPRVCRVFHKEAGRLGLLQKESQFMLTFLDHWDDVPMERKRSCPSITLKPDVALPDGPLALLQAPGGLYACTPHFGSYETIGETWQLWRREWLPTSGWEPDPVRPSFEWYQNDPRTLPPELLLTLLCDPVKRG